MRVAILVFCLSMSPALRAADTGMQAAIQELGAVLAWRRAPEAIEGWCRNVDPDGAAARKAALDSWRQKNDERIKAVDTRVAEVVPLLKLPVADADPVQAVHMQIDTMLLESTFASKSPDESRAFCKEEADPARPRWNDTGMPHIQQSLAALYDWLQTQKKQP
jgi:hypothetical protein